ncbi:MAG: nuclease [Candidatus Methylomirabilales bacterium]
MNPALKIPPASKALLTPSADLVERLRPVVGRVFRLSGKTRTDGSNIRRVVASMLEMYPLPAAAPKGSYRIVPPKRKGVPRILREFLDTYIVTSGDSYNLQVWNRNPASESVQVEYDIGPPLLASDVRFVFVRVNPAAERIRSVLVLSPTYIVHHFGKFGRPTVKHQLIISGRARADIVDSTPPILFYADDPAIGTLLGRRPRLSKHSIRDELTPGSVVPLETIRDLVSGHLIRMRIPSAPTKNRGQALEEMVARMLGYSLSEQDLLAGGYPDIRHQALEIKVQDSPTVDLGRYSPEFEELVPSCPRFTTRSLRYLIALTDESTGVVQGAVVAPGAELGKHFTFVPLTSFKSQRSMPMTFFDAFDGMTVYNP